MSYQSQLLHADYRCGITGENLTQVQFQNRGLTGDQPYVVVHQKPLLHEINATQHMERLLKTLQVLIKFINPR